MGAGTALAQTPPPLRFETSGAESAAEARLRRIDPARLGAIMQFVGLNDGGAPITVVLASEDSDVARATPSWVVGFANGPSDTVVLLPARSPRYPHDSLQSVLHHEVAHVLIGRAAAGRPVPRWFHEGVATMAERSWHFDDTRQLAWVLLTGGPVAVDRVDALFSSGYGSAAAAYAFSSAFVRHLMEIHGSDVPARVLTGVARDLPFEQAFIRATGEPVRSAEGRFHASLFSWVRWMPALTSPLVIWMGVTLLAVYAIYVCRRRNAERRQLWEEEETLEQFRAAARERGANVRDGDAGDDEDPDEAPPPRSRVH
jgi:hypothetical protein